MKISTGRRYKLRHRALDAIFIRNPSLILGFDLPFLIATSTSLKNAVAMSIEMAGIHLVTMAVSVIFARKLPFWVRAVITTVVAAVMMILLRELLIFMFQDIANSLGMYVYLLAVNGLTLFQSFSLTPRSKLVPVMKKEMFHVLAFVLTMFTLSFLREYFGYGMLWGVEMPVQYKMSGLTIPFMGFIMLGFVLAFLRFFNHKLIGFAMEEAYRRESRYIIRTTR